MGGKCINGTKDNIMDLQKAAKEKKKKYSDKMNAIKTEMVETEEKVKAEVIAESEKIKKQVEESEEKVKTQLDDIKTDMEADKKAINDKLEGMEEKAESANAKIDKVLNYGAKEEKDSEKGEEDEDKKEWNVLLVCWVSAQIVVGMTLLSVLVW